MSAATAIRQECRSCNTLSQNQCVTKVCQLHPNVWTGKRSKVRQIKAHCLDCVGTIQQVKDCTGKLLRPNDNGNMCYLHPYRTGKNPARKKSGRTPSQIFQRKPIEKRKTGVKIDDLR
jgi:hypothetical protein